MLLKLGTCCMGNQIEMVLLSIGYLQELGRGVGLVVFLVEALESGVAGEYFVGMGWVLGLIKLDFTHSRLHVCFYPA